MVAVAAAVVAAAVVAAAVAVAVLVKVLVRSRRAAGGEDACNGFGGDGLVGDGIESVGGYG